MFKKILLVGALVGIGISSLSVASNTDLFSVQPAQSIGSTKPSTAKPAAPTKVYAEDKSTGNKAYAVKISWQDNSSSETSFIVYRHLPLETKWTPLGKAGKDLTLFIDKTAKPAVAYNYTVRAYNNNAPKGKAGSVYNKYSDYQTNEIAKMQIVPISYELKAFSQISDSSNTDVYAVGLSWKQYSNKAERDFPPRIIERAEVTQDKSTWVVLPDHARSQQDPNGPSNVGSYKTQEFFYYDVSVKAGKTYQYRVKEQGATQYTNVVTFKALKDGVSYN